MALNTGRGSAFWQAPFRPLFLSAALWAMAAPLVWVGPWSGSDPVFWHLHEFMFGMAGAAVGGYLLIALPSWAGRSRGQIGPARLQILLMLWIIARLGLLAAEALPLWALLVAVGGYFLWLAGLLLFPLVAARAWSKLPLACFPLLMAAADGAFVAQWRWHGLDPQIAFLMVLAFAIMIGRIAGRAVPAFSKSWLTANGVDAPVSAPRFHGTIAAAGVCGGAGLAVSGHQFWAGILLLLTGGLQILRVNGWQPRRALGSPALAMLFAAWLWLGIGLIAVGLALIRPDLIPLSTALHALTMGAMGSMIMAIAARPAMRRRRGILVASRPMIFGFGLVWLSPLFRLGAAFSLPLPADPIRLAAAIWMIGWLLFLLAFLPALRGAPPHPVLSARRVARATGLDDDQGWG